MTGVGELVLELVPLPGIGTEDGVVLDSAAQFLGRLGSPDDGRRVERSVLSGRPGFAVRRYAEESGADLLAVNSPDGRYGLIDRIFTHGMEHILEDLPCNILIVHSRPAAETEARFTDG